MTTRRTRYPRPGDLYRLNLPHGGFGYARVRADDTFAVYLLRTVTPLTRLEDLPTRAVAFTVNVSRLVGRDWTLLGNFPLEEQFRAPAVFIKGDLVYDTADLERPAQPGDAELLEPAACWEPNGVAERLEDVLNGRDNVELAILRGTHRAPARSIGVEEFETAPSLTVEEFEDEWRLHFAAASSKCSSALERMGLQAGGATWLSILEARIAEDIPEPPAHEFDDEASSLTLRSSDERLVHLVASWIREFEENCDALTRFVSDRRGRVPFE